MQRKQDAARKRAAQTKRPDQTRSQTRPNQGPRHTRPPEDQIPEKREVPGTPYKRYSSGTRGDKKGRSEPPRQNPKVERYPPYSMTPADEGQHDAKRYGIN